MSNPSPELLKQVTSGAAWRKPREEGIVFHFPNGNTAIVRPVSTHTFLAAGKIPDMLSGVVTALLQGGMEALNNLGSEDLMAVSELQNMFCKTCIVYPAIVDDPKGEGEMSLDDLSDLDKGTLFSFLGRPAIELATFRPQQNGDVALVDSEQSGGETAVKPARN
jgi:hypothetical protein